MRHELSAASAERGANGDLALPRGAAGEQEIGDIRTRDEQHQDNGGEQDQQRRAHIARLRFTKRTDFERGLGIDPREDTPVLRVDEFQGGVGAVDGDAGAQTGGDANVVGGGGAVRVGLEGEPDLRRRVGLEIASDDARDEVRFVAERDGVAHDGQVGMESAHPESMADYRRVSAIGPVFVGGEAAPEFHARAEEMEVGRGDVDGLHLLGLIAARQVDARPAEIVGRDVFEDLRLLRQQVDRRDGMVRIAAVGSGKPDLHNAIGFGVRKRGKQRRVD